MYKSREWQEGDVAQYFPPHIYSRPQPCIIKEVDSCGVVRRIFFHERPPVKPGLEDFGINEAILRRSNNHFLQEYEPPVLTIEDGDIFE